MVYKASSHPKYDSNVVKIQQNLNALQEKLGRTKWAYLNPDGLYGPSTAQAVKAFQKEYKCAPYDGIYGPDTDMALKWALENAETTYNAIPVATASINRNSGPHTIFPGGTSETSQEITAPNEYSKYTSNLAFMKQTKTGNEKFHSVLNKTLTVWAPVQTGLESGMNALEESFRKYNNLNVFERLWYKKKIAEDFKKNMESAVKSGASKADTKVIKEIESAVADSTNRYAELKHYSVEKVKQDIQQNLSRMESSNKARVKQSTTKATEIVTRDLATNNLSEAGTLARIKSALNYKGAVKALGHGANILAFHEAIDMVVREPDFDNSQWWDKFKTKIYEGIDSLIIGLISTLITQLLIFAAVAAGLVESVGAITAAIIGLVVGAVLGIVYVCIKDENTKPFSEWVVSLIPKHVVERSLNFYTIEKARSGGCL